MYGGTLAPANTKIAVAVLAVLAGSITTVSSSLAAFNYNEQDRQERWHDLKIQVFGGRTVQLDDGSVRLDAPETAIDAALVPVTISLSHPKDVKALTLFIDDNPSPVAAHFIFGPDIDPGTIKLRVRVNHITDVHAVAETKEGRLIQTARLVKASGGCSAPMGMSDEDAMRGIGDMRLKLASAGPDRPLDATLMIRHPNFNGMQMNEAMHVFTPARYIQTIDVTLGGRLVIGLTTDISLSTDPVISFLLPAASKGDLHVDVKDSKGQRWSKSFPIPSVGN